MKRFRFLKAACAGIFIYVLLNVAAGKDSVWAMNQLQKQKREISSHTDSIRKVNDELNLEKKALEKDNDLIASYARKLGYVREGEKIVIISGLPAVETQIFDPGTIMKHKPVNYISESICKMAGLIVFAIIYFLLLLADINRGYLHFNKKSKSSVAAGITV